MLKASFKAVMGVLLVAAMLLAVVAVCGSMGGCGWSDPATPVPKPIREKLNAPAEVPLSKVAELTGEYQDLVQAEVKKKTADNSAWKKSKSRQLRDLSETIEQEGLEREADVQAVLDSATAALSRFDASAKASQQKAEAFAGKLWGIIDLGTGLAQNSGVPLLPIGVGALSTIAALFVPRPGEKKKTDQAYDQGVNAGLLMDRTRVAAVHPTPDLLPAAGTVVPPAAG